MLWHLLKYYMSFVIAVYFKKTKVKNIHNLRVKGPVIIAMNHPNAFMDPVAFTTLIYPPRVFYLARGDAFKKGIVSTLLESLGIIPIFRIQDGGKEGLKKNDETYDRVNLLLKKNKKIIIFAEGLCIQERRLRPLKKGVPRMVFGAMDTYNLNDLTVVPLGVNYSNPSQFRSNVFFNIGEPIKIGDYMAGYKESPAKTMNQFLADLTPKMKELIVHINHKHNEKVISDIEKIYKSTYFKINNLNKSDLENDFNFSIKVVDIINKAEEAQPENVAALQEITKHYFAELLKYNIKDWLFDKTKQSYITYFSFYARLFFIIITLPIYLRGLLASYIPYRLTYFITNKKVKLIEFKASFNMGIGAFLFLLWYTLQFFIAKAIAPNFWWALLVIFISVLSSLFCLWLSPFRKKTFGILKALQLKSKDAKTHQHLLNMREEIIIDFEKLI